MADLDVCCDDSCNEHCRYMVYAGVMLPRELATTVGDNIGRWREAKRLTGEIKWAKTTPHKLERFKTFASGSMRYINSGRIRFGAAIFDRHDRKLFRGSTREERWENLAFDFLLNCFAMRTTQNDRVWIYPDQGMLKCNSERLCEKLNAGIAFRKGWRGVDVIRAIKPRQSESCHFVQMVDLFAGAIGASNNINHDLSSRRGMAKENLLQHVRSLTNGDLKHGSITQHPFFNVWSYVPRIKKAAHMP
jgi:hypothetical protein